MLAPPPSLRRKRSLLPILCAGLIVARAGTLCCAADVPKEVVFASYNVRNYLLSALAVDPGERPGPVKPLAEINALIDIIRDLSPDILGLCEMGSRSDFADFQKRLHDAGLIFLDAEYVDAADPERHLALLSRFPLSARDSRGEISFALNGSHHKVRRGLLDVTASISENYQLRLVGVHLKSKLDAPEGDALLRRYEAHLVRRHVEQIMTGQPNVNLLLYGDFNELKNEPALQEIMGRSGAPDYMAELALHDAVGDRWTHHWKAADIYSRIDFIFVSRGLSREVLRAKSRVHRALHWEEASDHRPLVALITPVEQR